jgi:hypothetical protein
MKRVIKLIKRHAEYLPEYHFWIIKNSAGFLTTIWLLFVVAERNNIPTKKKQLQACKPYFIYINHGIKEKRRLGCQVQ